MDLQTPSFSKVFTREQVKLSADFYIPMIITVDQTSYIILDFSHSISPKLSQILEPISKEKNIHIDESLFGRGALTSNIIFHSNHKTLT